MKKDTRNHIIQTASELFYQKGYNLTGINEIIEESDIAKATLYSHFKSKEELLIAYLDAKDTELIQNLKAFTSQKPKGDRRIVAVLEFLIPFFKEENFNGCWCVRSVAEVPRENATVRSKIRTNKTRFKNFLSEIVQENKPKLSKSKREHLSNELYLLYEGAITEAHIHQDEWPIQTSIRLLKDKLKSN